MILSFDIGGIEDTDIEVEFEYDSFEPMTRHYPGSSESVAIGTVTIMETGSEICLLPKFEKELSNIILDEINEAQDEDEAYHKYGYLLDY
jgi:hypothetical protein